MVTTTPSLRQLHQQGDHAGVLRLARTIDVHPSADPQSALIVAASLFRLDRFRECLQICAVLEPVLQSEPTFLTLYATALRRLGERDSSEKIFQVALEHHPTHLAVLNNYAALLIDSRRFEEAERHLRRALELRPDYVDAQANLQLLNDLRSRCLPAAAGPDPQVDPGAGGDSTEQPAPMTLDPLLLAFSDHEVQLDQDQRREQKASKNALTDLEQEEDAKPQQPSLPELPDLNELELLDELIQATREALIEKQPRTCLVLADQLRSHGGTAQVEAYRLAAEAYISLANFESAELCLHTLGSLGSLEDGDHVNLAALAMRRHDLQGAEHHLAQVQDVAAFEENLATLRLKIEARRAEEPLMVFTPEGIKMLKSKKSQQSARVKKSATKPS